jgi:uncharacterized delta-60 repeat protein
MRLAMNLLFTLVSFLVLGLFPEVSAEGASPPVITLQPTNVTLLGGAGTTLRVAAEGDPTPEYQWYFEQAALPGETFGFLGVFSASTLKQGSYFAVASNAVGLATSDVAVVTVVTSAPSFLSQPSNVTVTVGESPTLTLSVTATGLPPPSYTWWFNETNRLSSVSRNLTLIPARETNSGIYTVVLSNSVSSVTSAPMVLTVSPLPLVTVQPTNQTFHEGDLRALQIEAIGRLPLYYQWFFENAALAGATGASFTIPSGYPTNSGGYFCVVSNSAGVTTSEVATVTVLPAPTTAGSLDIHYTPNTNGWNVSDLILLEDDKVLIAGNLLDANLYQLNVNGTIDSSFATNVFSAGRIALQPDGKILVTSGNRLLRFDSSGVRDTNFAPSSLTLPNSIHDIGVQPDGGIVYVGYVGLAPRTPLGRLLPDGTQDWFFRTFEPPANGGVRELSGEIKVLAMLPNGGFLFPMTTLQLRHPNGDFDSTFSFPDSQTSSKITSIVPAPDRRGFYIMGTFTNIGSAVRRSFARLDNSGALDTTFVPPTNLLGGARAAAVQLDGKVVVAGFTIAGSNAVIRLNVDGSVDETFTPALLGIFNVNVTAMGIQSDGRILVGGDFIRVNGRRIHGLARLHGDPPAAPVIVDQPEDSTVTVGQNVSIRATVRPFGSASYQWFHNGALIATEKAPRLPFQSIGLSDAGDYQLVVSNSYGSVTSRVARMMVEPNPDTPGAVVLNSTPEVGGSVYAMEPTAGGKYLIAGNFNEVQGTPRPGLARINADGSLDTTFNPPEATPRSAFQHIRALAVTPSGAVYIGGAFTSVGGVKRQLIARLHSDGSLDASFDPGDALHGGDEQVNAIAVLPDSRVIAAGSFTYTSNYFGGTVARFHPNGILDRSFVPTIRGNARCLTLDSNTVFVGGTFPPSGVAFRLLENGSTDLGFSSGSWSGSTISIKVMPDRKVLLAGRFSTGGLVSQRMVVRLLSNGAVDPGFNSGTNLSTCFWVGDAGCGKVLVGGVFRHVDGQPYRNLARLNSDGTLDTTFDSRPLDGAVMAGFVSPSGDATVGGEFLTARGVTLSRVARINNGPYESPSIGAQPITQSVAEGTTATLQVEMPCAFPPPTFQWQFNGTNLVGETNLSLHIPDVRLGQDGSYRLILSNAVGVVTSAVAQLTMVRAPRVPGAPQIESTSIFSSNSVVRCLLALPDGKILVGGSFSNMFGVTRRGLFRLNADASLDGTFAYNTTNEVRAMALFTDGRIALNERAPLNNPNSRIVRLNADGTMAVTIRSWDEPRPGPRSIAINASNHVYVTREAEVFRTFDSWTKEINGNVHALAFQPDGKLLLAGAFSGVSGVPQTNLARLQTNGLVDRPFVPWAGTLYCMALQPDGRIVVGGQFTSAGGLIRRGVARFYSDGTLDEEFSPHPGVAGGNATVHAVALQPDGKVIIGGSFATYDGVPCNNLTRLNPDGTLDHTFQPGTGIGSVTNPIVNAITLVNDGGIFVGGSFSTFNGVPRHSLARAYNNPKILNFSRDEAFTEFSFLSLPDRTYIFESRSITEDSPWLPVRSVVGDGTIKSITHSNGTPDSLLYRLRVE